MTQLSFTPEYTGWLQEIKAKIKQTQVCADLAASWELKKFYELFSDFSEADVIVPRVGVQLKNEKVPRPGTKQVCLHLKGEAVPKPEEVFGFPSRSSGTSYPNWDESYLNLDVYSTAPVLT